MSGQDCPRCGKSPIEVTTMGQAEPQYTPACSCYPHPPLCVSCRHPLQDDGRCRTLGCPTADVLQPVPVVDPLWEDFAP